MNLTSVFCSRVLAISVGFIISCSPKSISSEPVDMFLKFIESKNVNIKFEVFMAKEECMGGVLSAIEKMKESKYKAYGNFMMREANQLILQYNLISGKGDVESTQLITGEHGVNVMTAAGVKNFKSVHQALLDSVPFGGETVGEIYSLLFNKSVSKNDWKRNIQPIELSNKYRAINQNNNLNNNYFVYDHNNILVWIVSMPTKEMFLLDKEKSQFPISNELMQLIDRVSNEYMVAPKYITIFRICEMQFL